MASPHSGFNDGISGSNDRIGLCIAGCGGLAQTHAERVNLVRDRVDLFFASRDADRAADYSARFAGVGWFGAYDTALADPRVHAVLYTTPHSLHLEDVKLAAANRKHVLMEKPIATTIADARAMAEVAAAAGIRLMVAENYRYVPSVIKAAELVAAGAIGRVLHMQAYVNFYQRSTGWRLSREMMGGGALIDGGIHLVSAIRLIGGEVDSVSAVTPPQSIPEMEGEDGIHLWLRCVNGAVGTLTYCWGAPGQDRIMTCAVLGDRGQIHYDFHGDWIELTTAAEKRVIAVSGDTYGFSQQLDAFLRYIELGEAPATSPEECTRDLAVVLAAHRSVDAGGAPVKVSSVL